MEKVKYTKVYPQPMSFMNYDKTHIIGYLNEKVIENYVPESTMGDETPEPITGYSYTGPERDGGTLLPCVDPSDYGELTNAIIRSRFTESNEIAIQRHYSNDPVAYADEWEDYNNFCEAAKVRARLWLGIE